MSLTPSRSYRVARPGGYKHVRACRCELAVTLDPAPSDPGGVSPHHVTEMKLVLDPRCGAPHWDIYDFLGALVAKRIRRNSKDDADRDLVHGAGGRLFP